MTKGVYKRGSVYWIRYAGLDGKIAFESSRSSKFKDAEALLHKRKQAISEGKQPEIKRIKNHTFRELVEEYLSWSKRQKSHATKARLIKQLTDQFGGLPLRRFNTMLIEQFQTGRLQRGNKPATVNRFLATLKHMFTKAVQWDMVEEDALKKIRQVKLLPENNRRLRYLSKEECQELISNCNEYLKIIVTVALNTGMRKGEILGLRWDNVDLKHGFILLDKTKNGQRREIPINDTLRRAFSSVTRRLDVAHVFYDPSTSKPYADVKRSFHTALRRSGIQDFRFHDLRHCFASHLVMAGIDLTTVRELLGHKDLTMTLRYSHLAPSHKVKALDILDATINNVDKQEELSRKVVSIR